MATYPRIALFFSLIALLGGCNIRRLTNDFQNKDIPVFVYVDVSTTEVKVLRQGVLTVRHKEPEVGLPKRIQDCLLELFLDGEKLGDYWFIARPDTHAPRTRYYVSLEKRAEGSLVADEVNTDFLHVEIHDSTVTVLSGRLRFDDYRLSTIKAPQPFVQ